MRADIAISAQRYLNMRRDSNFCAKSVRYNIFTTGAPQIFTDMSVLRWHQVRNNHLRLIRIFAHTG